MAVNRSDLVDLLAEALSQAIWLRDNNPIEGQFVPARVVDSINAALSEAMSPDLERLGLSYKQTDFRELLQRIRESPG